LIKWWQKVKRPFIKSVIWRVIALAFGVVVPWLFLGNFELSLHISLVGNGISFILYFIYEVIWEKIYWGRDGNKNK